MLVPPRGGPDCTTQPGGGEGKKPAAAPKFLGPIVKDTQKRCSPGGWIVSEGTHGRVGTCAGGAIFSLRTEGGGASREGGDGEVTTPAEHTSEGVRRDIRRSAPSSLAAFVTPRPWTRELSTSRGGVDNRLRAHARKIFSTSTHRHTGDTYSAGQIPSSLMHSRDTAADLWQLGIDPMRSIRAQSQHRFRSSYSGGINETDTIIMGVCWD